MCNLTKIFFSIFLCGLFIILFSQSTIATSYNLTLRFDTGNLTFENVKISSVIPIEESGHYNYKIISLSDKVLYQANFSLPDLITKIYHEKNGELFEDYVLTNESITLLIPYFDNAKEIRIYDPNLTLLLTIPVSQFSKNLCGDGTCQFYENVKSCPADCAAAVKPPVVEKPLTEKIASYVGENKTMLTISAILFVILIVLITLITRKKPQKT